MFQIENSLFLGVLKLRLITASLQCAWILGHLKNINFSFETNGKLIVLGVPILKHFRVVLLKVEIVKAQIIMKPVQPSELLVICQMMCFLCHISRRQEGKRLVLKIDNPLNKPNAFNFGSPMYMPGRVAQSVGHLTRKSGVLGSIPGRATYFFVSPSAFSRRAVVSYWRKYVHEVLVNRLGGLSLPRKSVVRLTDRPDMTLDVYRGRKTTIQQQQKKIPNEQ